MISERLPVYKRTMDLLNELTLDVNNMNKAYRYCYGNYLLKIGVESVALIVRANKAKSMLRVDALDLYIENLEIIKAIISICVNNRIFDYKTESRICLILDDIGKQITAWKNSSE